MPGIGRVPLNNLILRDNLSKQRASSVELTTATSDTEVTQSAKAVKSVALRDAEVQLAVPRRLRRR